jgi:hypothetical protein
MTSGAGISTTHQWPVEVLQEHHQHTITLVNMISKATLMRCACCTQSSPCSLCSPSSPSLRAVTRASSSGADHRLFCAMLAHAGTACQCRTSRVSYFEAACARLTCTHQPGCVADGAGLACLLVPWHWFRMQSTLGVAAGCCSVAWSLALSGIVRAMRAASTTKVAWCSVTDTECQASSCCVYSCCHAPHALPTGQYAVAGVA